MSYIPIKALRFGAESINQFPQRYSKSKISKSLSTSYILHPKGGWMPGQPEIFTPNARKIAGPEEAVTENSITRAFKLEKLAKTKQSIGVKHISDALNCFTFDQFHPNDDDSLKNTINASYKQIYGNLFAFESERPIELERRLRNGDITIREFIRQLAKSLFYKSNYFEKVTQQRCIELNIKHLLGRPPFNQLEIIKNIEFINANGFDHHIDLLIDSSEYFKLFGEHTVPYMRCWDSSIGIRVSSFINSSKLTQSFASSDNSLHSFKSTNNSSKGRSLLLQDLIKPK